ncbi:hypothetical protein HELRODRAFT_191120 [Helobdella robusta]|uniref:Uncharacterized protein n=1 Tax=Helobdella robusta TaxID=6412 RepID=T1FSM1_HELRO|nr:hypothetical protein HELRODRAFT_191120 [Helobdella robusta]ESO07279.1 hypothetical protein HELRODRAFT_191120 [Helobdella robusta]
MKSVDVVYCSYPASLCEIYLKLNKSVIVLATTRYDVGRYTVERLNELNENFRVLAKNPWNFFGGNNLYDARWFLEYYTGIKAKHLPSMCDYTKTEYKANNNNNNNDNNNNNKNKKRFLNYFEMIYDYIFKRNIDRDNTYMMMRRRDRGFSSIFLEEFSIACKLMNSTMLIEQTSGHEYAEVVKYRGIVHVPYQISVMSIFEQYRMNIPMFFPSPELLARWQVEYYIMPERSFEGAFFKERTAKSKIEADESQKNIPDPKNEFDYESVLYWMKFADFYQVMPYGVIYESIPHLVQILTEITDEQLMTISSNMRRYNVEFKKKLLRKWRKILLEYAKNSPNHPH